MGQPYEKGTKNSQSKHYWLRVYTNVASLYANYQKTKQNVDVRGFQFCMLWNLNNETEIEN